MDTKGPEIRSGFFAGGVKKIDLIKNSELILTSDYTFQGDSTKLACSYEGLAKSDQTGQTILVADGSLVLTVKSINEEAGEVTCNVENTASIGERKNMNLPGVVVDLPTQGLLTGAFQMKLILLLPVSYERPVTCIKSVKSWDLTIKVSRLYAKLKIRKG